MNASPSRSRSVNGSAKPRPPRTTSLAHAFHQNSQVGVADAKPLPLSSEPLGRRKVTLNDCVKFWLSEISTRGVICRSPKWVW